MRACTHADRLKMNEVRRILGEVLSVLKQHNSALEAGLIEKALEGADDDLRAFIISNELWGGAGSIADQALCGEPRGEATREV